MALVGTDSPSIAAVMTSAGRSIRTPSAYAKGSSGEYDGGAGSWAARKRCTAAFAGTTVSCDAADSTRRRGAHAPRSMSRWSGVGGFGVIGLSGGARASAARDSERDRWCERPDDGLSVEASVVSTRSAREGVAVELGLGTETESEECE
jgi:hypothetical protein